MGSISAKCATTKYSTEPLSATVRYPSRAMVIFASVSSVSSSLVVITAEVSYNSTKYRYSKSPEIKKILRASCSPIAYLSNRVNILHFY